MKRVFGIVLTILLLGTFVGGTSAKSEHVFSLPDRAREVAPGVFSLGSARDVDGTLVSGYAIVKKEAARSNSQAIRGPKANQCYSYLATGAKWKVLEDYLIEATNSAGLDPSSVHSLVAGGVGKWESAANANIFGNEVGGVVDGAETTAPDGKNEVMFGSIDSSGVIAVTTVWGVFGGPPQGRYLAEWDQVYDQNDFGWAVDGNPGDMDFENIAVHELGHAFGMGHPSDTCLDETMYRYATLGETKKRDLNTGDIKGIDSLY